MSTTRIEIVRPVGRISETAGFGLRRVCEPPTGYGRYTDTLKAHKIPQVQKVEIDSFSGYKIYPSRGRLFVRGDSKIFRFGTSKTESLFLQRKNPRKLAWTVVYRRMHKKGITEEIAKKRSRKTVKHQRGIVGADLAAIAAKRNQTTQVRTQQRLAALTKAKTEKKEKEAKKPKPQRVAPPTGGIKGLPKQPKGGRGGR